MSASLGRPLSLLAFLLLFSLPPLQADGFRFRDVTEAAGIDLVVISGTPEKKFLVETMTGGVCVLDYDGDGWPDLYFVNGTTREHWNRGTGPTDRLYRNNGDGTFRDVTAQAGLTNSAWGMGCAAADYDNDGRVDLYVTNFGPNFLYRNNGDGTFTEVGAVAGVNHPGWSTGAAFGDYDRDGYLDLYVANYVDFDFNKPAGDPRFCSYRGVTVACGPRGLPGGADVLYRNNGDGTFRDVSRSAKVIDSERLYGFQPLWTDIDLDGDLDVFVANDSTPNFLWINNGDGTFEESALLLGVAYNQEGREQANMGVDAGDYDNDGHFDLYSTNFSDDYNVLYQNSGKGYFLDATFTARLAQVTFRFLGFGALFADFDNDSWPDIFAANGHIYPEVQTFRLGSDYKQKNQLFQNRGDGTFQEVETPAADGLSLVRSSRGAALLDFDRDGDLDLVISNLDDRVDLLRNESRGGNYLQLQFRGRESNRQGIGVRVVLHAGGRRQMQELRAGSSYLSTSEPLLHFGLGAATKVDLVEVFWPSGKRQQLRDLPANRRLLVDETQGVQG